MKRKPAPPVYLPLYTTSSKSPSSQCRLTGKASYPLLCPATTHHRQRQVHLSSKISILIYLLLWSNCQYLQYKFPFFYRGHTALVAGPRLRGRVQWVEALVSRPRCRGRGFGIEASMLGPRYYGPVAGPRCRVEATVCRGRGVGAAVSTPWYQGCGFKATALGLRSSRSRSRRRGCTAESRGPRPY